MLKEKQRQEIRLVYKPSQLEVPVASAIFLLSANEEHKKIIKMAAVAKQPFVQVDHPKLEFEELIVGKKATQDYIL